MFKCIPFLPFSHNFRWPTKGSDGHDWQTCNRCSATRKTRVQFGQPRLSQDQVAVEYPARYELRAQGLTALDRHARETAELERWASL